MSSPLTSPIDPQAYQDIPLRHIRLLHIAASSDDGPLNGTLRTVSLDTDPEFNALSYVWGTFAPIPHTVLCDGIPIDVSTNGHLALLHLRKKLGSFTIWIDAICINQKDDEEKSKQIPLMGDIYQKAAQVYVWLGPATETSDRVVDYLATAGLQRFTSAVVDHPWYMVLRPVLCVFCWWARPLALAWRARIRANTSSRFTAIPRNGTTYHARSAAASLIFSWVWPTWHPFPLSDTFDAKLNRPWFSRTHYAYTSELIAFLDQEWLRRVWTYQEIILATNPVLVCGTSHLKWNDLAFALLFLSSTQHSLLEANISAWERLVFDKEKLKPSIVQAHEAFIRKVYVMYHGTLIISANVSFYAGIVLGAVGIWMLVKHSVAQDLRHAGIGLVVCGSILAIYGLSVASLASKVWEKSGVLKLKTEALPLTLYWRTAREPKDMAYGAWAILQQRGAVLPAPLYSREAKDIYQDLTTHMLRTTHSMDVLRLAAVQGMAHSPSWVPDWSAQTSWISTLRPTEMQTIPSRNRLGSVFGLNKRADMQTAFNEERRIAHWALTQVLTVEAHDLGTLSTCANFQRTGNFYTKEEKTLHVANLETMKQWHTKLGASSAKSLLELAGIEWQRRDAAAWNRCLRKDLSWDDTPMAFQQQQIMVCNILAHGDRRIWSADLGGITCVAASSIRAMPGDRVIRVKGMEQPLVVRLTGNGNATTIIGPFHVLDDRVWYKAFTAEKVQFVRYDIH